MMQHSLTELTPSERTLLRALLQGYGVRQVASARGESPTQTISDVRRVLSRLTAASRPIRMAQAPRPRQP